MHSPFPPTHCHASFLPPSLLSPCLAQLCDVMVREVCEGVEGTGVRCGVIGEVGVSYPMTDFEKKSLQASTKAQQITGTCTVHTFVPVHDSNMLCTLVTYIYMYIHDLYNYCKCTNVLVCPLHLCLEAMGKRLIC